MLYYLLSSTIYLNILCYIIVGDTMKKKLTMIFISISIGILFTILFLNKETFYAKEEYQVYAFQVASFNSLDNATKYKSSLPSSIIIKEDNSYKIIVGIYKDIDIVNKMLVYWAKIN